MIITFELKPGHKLSEVDLSKDLRISRPPLREAFRLLENDHLAVSVPRRGTFVSELSVEDFLHTAQAREMIECFAVDLFKSSNIRHVPKVRSAFEKALSFPPPQKDGERKIFLEYVDAFIGFHKEMIRATGNNKLVSIYDSISSHLARYQFMYFFTEGTAEHSVDDHRKIMESIEKGDYDQAKKQIREHIYYIVDLVKGKILARFLF
jgi:DNA-binding GntR family transcriptional regulator